MCPLIEKFIKWIKSPFYHNNTFFEFDENRYYSTKELIKILQNENLSLGTGNAIVLVIICRLNDKIDEQIK